MKKAELVLIPLPNIGHLLSILEFGKLLVDRDDRFYITVLLMNLPLIEQSEVNNYIHCFSASASDRIRFVHLPPLDPQLISTCLSNAKASSVTYALCCCIDDQKPLIRDAVKQLNRSKSTHLAGFVVDMLCTSMVDVADELGVPSYVFFTASAAFLGLMFHVLAIHDNQEVDVTELVDSDAELVVPSFVTSVPAQVLPPVLGEQGGGATAFLRCLSRFSRMKGILVNTFMDLESHAINSFIDGTSPIYPVGPLLNLNDREHLHPNNNLDIMKWLDDQPRSSVVFLCFGSNGFFPLDQVKEIAEGLERSRHRFLWCLRQPPSGDEIIMPSEYVNFEEALPQGFLGRTGKMGKVIGWAPQVAILAHPSVGGFVSHCGWNSILESLWHGVPIATWPIYSEQQLNAFQMVKDLGLGVEIKLDYKMDKGQLVSAEEIEKGIQNLMMMDSEVKRRASEMKEKSRNAVIDGGSSHSCLGHLIEDMIANIPCK